MSSFVWIAAEAEPEERMSWRRSNSSTAGCSDDVTNFIEWGPGLMDIHDVVGPFQISFQTCCL